MFLRKIVLVLIVANTAYFAYSQGWISRILGSDAAQREPERLAKQINPEALAVSLAPTKASASLAISDAPAAVKCNPSANAEEQWLVYMGPYASRDLLEKKMAELQRLGVTSKEVSKTSLPKGLSLGQFASEAQARASWQALQAKGIKTATVILWSAPTKEKAC